MAGEGRTRLDVPAVPVASRVSDGLPVGRSVALRQHVQLPDGLRLRSVQAHQSQMARFAQRQLDRGLLIRRPDDRAIRARTIGLVAQIEQPSACRVGTARRG